MTLRVPNHRLDSTLKAITGLVDYLDYRTIKAEDVALQIKANQKTMQRAAHNGQRLRQAIDNRGRRLGETADAEDQADVRQQEADNAEIANLSLEDQVNYSTVSLEMYQRAETRHWVVPGDTNIDDFRPGLGWRLWDALKAGWRIVEELLVLVTRLWLLLLLGLAGWLLYRRFRPGKLSLK